MMKVDNQVWNNVIGNWVITSMGFKVGDEMDQGCQLKTTELGRQSRLVQDEMMKRDEKEEEKRTR